MKLDFILAGIMKSGTTYLDDFIRKHPQIYMPERSMNYSFFDNDNIYKNGIEWYESIFTPKNDEPIIGQTSADCAFNPGSIARIKKHYPDAKLIFIVRHPIDRSYSLYWHQIRMGRENLSFEKVIEKESSRIKKDYYHFKMYSYITRSRYKRQFDKIFNHYSEDQVLIVPFELCIKNELAFLNLIFGFIGADKITSLDDLNFEKKRTNPARIPSNKFILHLSYYLQKIGFKKLGRYIILKSWVEKRPPKLEASTRSHLEKELAEDIAFHQSLLDKYHYLLEN